MKNNTRLHVGWGAGGGVHEHDSNIQTSYKRWLSAKPGGLFLKSPGSKVLARRVSSRPMDAHFGRNTRKIHLIFYNSMGKNAFWTASFQCLAKSLPGSFLGSESYFMFAVFTFKIKASRILTMTQWNYQLTKQNWLVCEPGTVLLFNKFWF